MTSPKVGLGGVAQSVNQQLAAPLGMESLSASAGPSASSVTTKATDVNIAAVRASALTSSLRDPLRLREAILVNELLQPPLALRGRSRRG